MKPVVYAVAGAAIALCLAAGPAAAQRERPAGAGASGGAVGGGSHAGGGGGSSSGGSSVSSSGGSTSSGGGSAVGGSSGSGSGGTAVRRNGAGSGDRANGRGAGYARPEYGSDQDRAVPRGARPNPGASVIGQATLRPNGPGQPGRPSYNWGYWDYYYPWYYYNPWFYGVGAFGWGSYGYPYSWGDSPYGEYDGNGYAGEAGEGTLKLKVDPNDAEVYVDGYYTGIVDDFDGAFQGLKLEAGPHKIEIRAPGFRTITFDVRIEPHDTVTYRGELQEIKK
jgi:hypothetical protein